MKKKLLGIVLGIVTLFFIYFSFIFVEYFCRQNENKGMIEFCSQNSTEDCYTRMFELLLPKMLIHNAWVDGVEIDLLKLESTARVDCANALYKASTVIGYGVLNDVNYEVEYSRLFNKYSYAFDCGVENFVPDDRLCKFAPECIASDKFLIMNQISTGKVHSFEQKLKELEMWDKQVFVKMDVAEADSIVIPELIKNSDKITGLNIGLHIRSPKAIIERLPILDELNKNFVLVARNTPFFDDNHCSEIIESKYYNGVLSDRVLYLSYVNKNILDSYSIQLLQNTDKYYKKKKVARLFYTSHIPLSDISLIVTIPEKIKEFLGKINKK